MKESEHEIIVLKPTTRFLSFVLEQREKIDWLDYQICQQDTTAYTLPKHQSDEGLLEEIAKHFPAMFRHEVERRLGVDLGPRLKTTLSEFLSFFKLELHSQLVPLV